MKMTIESTADILLINGVPVRVWEGLTAGGVRCKVFVHRIAVHVDEDCAEFDREMAEQLPPELALLVGRLRP